MDPISRIFFTHDPVDLESAKEVVSKLEKLLPSCIELLKRDPGTVSEKIENLRERISSLEAGEARAHLLGQLGRCRTLFNELIGRVSPSGLELSGEEVLEAIDSGNLGLALDLIKTEGLSLEGFERLIEPNQLEWIRLNLEFSPSEPPTLDAMALTKSGERVGLGWGYKAANLAVMRKHAEEATTRCTSSIVRVPEFIPLSDIEMRCFIQSKYPDLEKDWRRFQTTLDPEKGELTAAGLVVLEKIQQSILKCFEEHSYAPPQLIKWLEENNPQLLAVRSTGKEDSKTNSNAGGNDTELYVKPTSEEISKAMGRVLSSYFSEKSIRLRLAKEDRSVLTEELFLPVLIQTMVSKPEAGGILFTGGDLGELVELSVVCGHPHGVAGGEGTADRFFVDIEAGEVAKSVRSKKSEFRDGVYQPTTPQNRDSPAISDECARDMKAVATYYSQEVYRSDSGNESLNIEFSVEEGVIHLLQLRPLIRGKSPDSVSYIALDTIDKSCEIIGKTLLSDGSYVRNSEETIVLVCDTLEEAEKLYTEASLEVRSKIATVVVRKPAPTTSHAAVNLIAAGIGAIVIEKTEEFRRVRSLIEGGKKCFIDLQQGALIHADEVDIRAGYVCFPIPLEYSVAPSAMIRHNSREELRLFATKLDTLIGESLGPGDTGMRELLQEMSVGSEVQVRAAAANLLFLLRGLIRKASVDPAFSAEKQLLLMITEEIVKIVEKQLIPVATSEPRSLKRLYPIRLIEACLYQEGSVIGGFSIKTILEAVQNQKKLASALEVSFADAVAREGALAKAPYVRARFSIIDSKEQALFDRFMQSLHLADPVQVENIGKFFLRLNNLGILTEWVNRELGLILERGDIHTVFEHLCNVARNSFEEMKRCERTLLRVKELRSKISNWEDPKYVQSHMHNLLLEFKKMGFEIEGGNPASFIVRYELASDLGKLAILETMKEVVDLYDEMIKTVKISRRYPTEKGRLKHFKAMLGQYRLMMQICLQLTDQMGRKISELGTWRVGAKVRVEDYLHAIDVGGDVSVGDTIIRSPGFDNIDVESLSESGLATQILPSKHFDVSAIIVTATGDFLYSRVFPGTLEDYFTLFHQNMLASIGRVRSNFSIPEEKLPKALRDYKGILGSRFSRIDVRNGKIVVESDIPVRQHAVRVEVSYDLVASRSIVTKISFFGANEGNRWEYLAATLAAMGEDIPNLEFEPPKITYGASGGVTLEFTDHGLGDKLVELEAFIATINFSTESLLPPTYFCDLVMEARESLGVDPTIPFSREDLKRGAFFIAPMVVYQFIQEGKLVEAKALLTKLEELQLTMPQLKDVKISDGFFPHSDRLWGNAIKELEPLVEGVPPKEEGDKDLFDIEWGGDDDLDLGAFEDPELFQPEENPLFKKYLERHGNLLNRSFHGSPEDKKVLEILLDFVETDKKMAIRVVSLKGLYLNKLEETLQNDPQIIEAAVSEDARVLDKLTPDALHNPRLAVAVVQKHPEMLLRFSEEVRSNSAVIERVVRKSPAALQFAGPEFSNNQALAQFAWSYEEG